MSTFTLRDYQQEAEAHNRGSEEESDNECIECGDTLQGSQGEDERLCLSCFWMQEDTSMQQERGGQSW